MISNRVAERYYKWSGDLLFCTGGPWILSRASDKQKFTVPAAETDETFADRIKRSKKAGRNLFYEEFEEFNPDPCDLY